MLPLLLLLHLFSLFLRSLLAISNSSKHHHEVQPQSQDFSSGSIKQTSERLTLKIIYKEILEQKNHILASYELLYV